MGPAGYPVLVPQFESALEAKKRYMSLRDMVDQRRVRDLQVRRLELQEQEDLRKREQEEQYRTGLTTLPADADPVTALRHLGPKGLPLIKELDDARNAKLTREKTEAELNTTRTNFRTTQGKVLRDAVAAALEEDDDERRTGMIRGFGQRMVDYGIAGQDVVNGPPMTRDQLKALHQRLFIETEGLPGWEKELARRAKEERDVEAFNVAQRTATANATVAERNALGEAVSPAPVLPQKWYEGWLQANNRRDSPTNYYRAFSEWKVLDAPPVPLAGRDVVKPQAVVEQDIAADIRRAAGIAAATAGTKPPAAPEIRALGFYRRMKDAEDVVTNLEGTMSSKGLASQAVFQYAPNWLQSDENQVYRQAQRQFTEARLRKESGAAISPAEYENDAKTYFPQPGDSKAALERKKKARASVLGTVREEAGRAYKEEHPDASPAQKPATHVFNPRTGRIEAK